jgi:hypothetical protein
MVWSVRRELWENRSVWMAPLAVAALFVVAFNAFGLFADPHFALPVAPAFVFFGACMLLGRRTA